MSNNNGDKFDCFLFMKTFWNNFLKKIFKKTPIFNKEIPDNIQINETPISGMDADNQKILYQSFSEIFDYSEDFKELTIIFLIESDKP